MLIVYKLLFEHDITTTNQSVITFSDSSCIDCIDTGRSTGGHITFIQGGEVDYRSRLPVPVAMSSGEADYISAADNNMSQVVDENLDRDFVQ